MFWCEGLDSQLSRRLHQSIQLSSPRRKAKMCLQVRERYSCHCLYYQLGVDRCPQYGRRGHTIQRRTKYVGNACARHSEGRYNQRYSNLEHDISRDAEGDVDSSSANSRHPQKGDSAVPAARRPLDWRDMSQRLLELEPLRHLWPQVVRKCKSTADEQARIEEFVLRFCFDPSVQLDGEGEDGLSARIIEILSESLGKIRGTIWQAQSNPCEIKSFVMWPNRWHVLDDTMGRKGSNQYWIEEPTFTNEEVDKILLESAAMRTLQARMVNFISSAPQEPAPMLVLRGLRMWLENTMEYLIRVPPGAAVTRVSWRCVSL